MTALSALLVVLNFHGVRRDEVAEWYRAEHIPERVRFPSWIDGHCWLAANGEDYLLAIFDVETPEVFQAPAYRDIAFENLTPWTRRIKRLRPPDSAQRYECLQIHPGDSITSNARYAYLRVLAVETDVEGYEDWYINHHLPKVAGRSIGVQLRAFRVTGPPEPRRYLEVYQFDSAAMLDSLGHTGGEGEGSSVEIHGEGYPMMYAREDLQGALS